VAEPRLRAWAKAKLAPTRGDLPGRDRVPGAFMADWPHDAPIC
jgi:hypothetical protein